MPIRVLCHERPLIGTHSSHHSGCQYTGFSHLIAWTSAQESQTPHNQGSQSDTHRETDGWMAASHIRKADTRSDMDDILPWSLALAIGASGYATMNQWETTLREEGPATPGIPVCDHRPFTPSFPKAREPAMWLHTRSIGNKQSCVVASFAFFAGTYRNSQPSSPAGASHGKCPCARVGPRRWKENKIQLTRTCLLVPQRPRRL